MVAADAPTEVVVCKPSSQDVADKVPASELAHFPADKPVRLVKIGARRNWCPCGGTHVKRAGQLNRVVLGSMTVKKKRTKVYYTVEDAGTPV